jgi:pantoate--beta-alanine ligase
MRVIKSVKSMQRLSSLFKKEGKKIGLVPTMGFLHEGHLSLVDIARKRCDKLVVSIFVNPLQFGPREDLSRYPRDLKRDIRLLKERGTDFVFIPDERDMYPDGFHTYVEVEKLTNVLCGKSRPGHFRGVTTVVLKLFNIIKPDIAVFGEKDAQQAIIIKRMVEDLNLSTKIITGPTIRERDGLAMSSRNMYLTQNEREDAVVLYKSLLMAREMIKEGEYKPREVIEKMRQMIAKKETARIDYVSIIGKKDLAPVKKIEGEVLVALAVWFGKARLIDNITIKYPMKYLKNQSTIL